MRQNGSQNSFGSLTSHFYEIKMLRFYMRRGRGSYHGNNSQRSHVMLPPTAKTATSRSKIVHENLSLCHKTSSNITSSQTYRKLKETRPALKEKPTDERPQTSLIQRPKSGRRWRRGLGAMRASTVETWTRRREQTRLVGFVFFGV